MIKHLTSQAEVDELKGVIVYSAPWCGPCKSYKPMLEAWAAERGIPLAQVDVDAHRDLAVSAKVRAVPTTVFVGFGPTQARTGALSRADLDLYAGR